MTRSNFDRMVFPPLKEGDRGGVSLSLVIFKNLIPSFPPFSKGGHSDSSKEASR